MTAKSLARLLALILAAAASSPSAATPDTGMAGSIHDLRREGKKVCIVDHWHYGSGVGGTKKRAEADAIKSWTDFTILEYGTAWGNFTKAANRSVSCSSDPQGFSCNVEGRPCR